MTMESYFPTDESTLRDGRKVHAAESRSCQTAARGQFECRQGRRTPWIMLRALGAEKSVGAIHIGQVDETSRPSRSPVFEKSTHLQANSRINRRFVRADSCHACRISDLESSRQRVCLC